MSWEEFKVQRQRLGPLLEPTWATLGDDELDSAGDKRAFLVEALERRHAIPKKHAQLLLVRWFAVLPNELGEAVSVIATPGAGS